MTDGIPIPTWLDGVEGDESSKIIEATQKYIQIVAGPGSGKTFSLKRRVERLIVGEGTPLSQIFVGTFTRAIRAELREALAQHGATSDDAQLSIETIHAQAYSMLRASPQSHPGRSFRFLLKHEEDAMLHDLGLNFGHLNVHQRRNEMHKVESDWAAGQTLADERFRGAMTTWLEEHVAMHINEVPYLALRAVQRGDIPGGIFSNVIVDEYQDLTAVEQLLVERLCSEHGSLMVLGDDDQSIYRFRHNHPGGITEFANGKSAGEIAQIQIPDNRRCGSSIVDLANRMMAAAGSTKPPMVSRRGEVGNVDTMFWATSEEEIEGLARYVESERDKEFLILVTRRQIGYRLRARIGDEASTSFHQEVLRTKLALERFSLAALLADEDDRVSMRAWLGFSSDGSLAAPQNAPAVDSLRQSGLRGRALLEAIANETVRPTGVGQAAVQLRSEHYLAHSARTREMDLEGVIRYLFDPGLAQQVGDVEERRYTTDDLELLRDASLEQMAQIEQPSLIKIIERLRYRISTTLPLLDSETVTRVRIMTLHGAKGLEGDIIIVAGLADELLPGEDDSSDPVGAREEQRRLLYVAVTRAKKRLILSWSQAMTYQDARRQNARASATFRAKGMLMSGLSASRFIPDTPRIVSGPNWLRALGL